MIKRANILLMADARQYTDTEIAETLSAGTSTVYRTKRDFVEYGLEIALAEDDRPGGARKLDAKEKHCLYQLLAVNRLAAALGGPWSFLPVG